KMPQSGLPRNVFVYDANVPKDTDPILVAGFMQLGRTTGGEFYFCLEFCFTQPQSSQFRLMASDGTILSRDSTIVPAGNYFVVSPGLFPIFAVDNVSSGSHYICFCCTHSRRCSTSNNIRRESFNRRCLALALSHAN